MKIRGGVEMIAAVRLGFLYAYGRGVPLDRAKARQLFAWREGSAFAYLLDRDRLPQSYEDVTPQFIQTVKDQEIASKLAAFALLAAANSDEKPQAGTGDQMSRYECKIWTGENSMLQGIAGCWP